MWMRYGQNKKSKADNFMKRIRKKSHRNIVDVNVTETYKMFLKLEKEVKCRVSISLSNQKNGKTVKIKTRDLTRYAKTNDQSGFYAMVMHRLHKPRPVRHGILNPHLRFGKNRTVRRKRRRRLESLTH